MKKKLLILSLLILCFSCNAQKKDKNTERGYWINDAEVNNTKIETTVEQKTGGYTFEEFRTEFKDTFDEFEMAMGVYFWDEFNDLEALYNLTENESKLLGKWMNITYKNLSNNYYTFYPNKLFILGFFYENIQITDAEKMYFNKAVGTWEIAGGIVRITIYAIVTADRKLDWRNNKGVFFVENPYTVDFININNIGREGFTKRPINDTVLSEELKQMVTVIKPNRTNNLYARNVYTINLVPPLGKNYNYFRIVPDLARENLTGLEVATNPELIEKYIFPLWP
jgi:hypothetical protein